jgi:hypothetical protein
MSQDITDRRLRFQPNSSSVRSSREQLWRHHVVGYAVRHLRESKGVDSYLRVRRCAGTAVIEDAGVPRRASGDKAGIAAGFTNSVIGLLRIGMLP